MNKHVAATLTLTALLLCSGCGIEQQIFPIWPPEPIDPPPAPLGPNLVDERVTSFIGPDGVPVAATVFTPVGVDTPLPTLVWVMGVNNRVYFQQSLHEYLASWGYAVVVPTLRDLSFLDTNFHGYNTSVAVSAVDAAMAGELGFVANPQQLALGGYSVGGTMAAMAAGLSPEVNAVAMWAPSPSPFWTGAQPQELLPLVAAPSLFVLGSRDNVAPPDEWPAEMQQLMVNSPQTVEIIPDGVHVFFQQSLGVGNGGVETPITRREQQAIAQPLTLEFLDATLGVDLDEP